jgi:hypothetical protein
VDGPNGQRRAVGEGELAVSGEPGAPGGRFAALRSRQQGVGRRVGVAVGAVILMSCVLSHGLDHLAIGKPSS